MSEEKEEIKQDEQQNDKQKQDEQQNNKQLKDKKLGFFKKVWYSITKIEKYPDMAAEGLGKSISYLAKIVLILAIVLCLGMMYQTYQLIQEGVTYLQNEFPDFSYQDGKLDINSEDAIIISDKDSVLGKTIINTKTENEQEINKYINEIEDVGNGIIILKDKVILKNQSVTGTINYNYNEIFGQMGINQFNKQDVINYANSYQIMNLYISVFLTILIYSFIMYFLTTISNVVFLSIFGYLATWIAKIKMRYVAIFNMSIYALTLSIILNMIYVAINVFVEYNMEYFQVMYVAVAAIYLVAAIFLLKTEFIKKQEELMKIVEAQEIIRKQLEEQEREKEEKEKEQNKETGKKENKENKENKEENKKDKTKGKENKEKQDNDNQGEEPEGLNA